MKIFMVKGRKRVTVCLVLPPDFLQIPLLRLPLLLTTTKTTTTATSSSSSCCRRLNSSSNNIDGCHSTSGSSCSSDSCSSSNSCCSGSGSRCISSSSSCCSGSGSRCIRSSSSCSCMNSRYGSGRIISIHVDSSSVLNIYISCSNRINKSVLPLTSLFS